MRRHFQLELPPPICSPGKANGQRILAGHCSSDDRVRHDLVTEQTTTTDLLSYFRTVIQYVCMCLNFPTCKMELSSLTIHFINQKMKKKLTQCFKVSKEMQTNYPRMYPVMIISKGDKL